MGIQHAEDGHGQHGDGQHNTGTHPGQDHHDKLHRDAHGSPPKKGTTGEGSNPPKVRPAGTGEGSGPPTTVTSGPPGEGTGPPGEGTGPPGGGGHHETTPPVIFIPPWIPPTVVYPIVPPPKEVTPVPPTTEHIPGVTETPAIPVLLKTPPVDPEDRSFTRDITVTNPKPKDPGITPPPPTGVFTGQGHEGPAMERRYKQLYTSGKYSAHPGEENLSAPSIGLNHIKIDHVGTGADEHLKKHRTEMVAPHDPYHLGEWKYDLGSKTVIAAHVAFKGTPGPLYELKNLGVHNGVPDRVTLEGKDGKKTTYEYVSTETVKDPKDKKIWDKVFTKSTADRKELVLVTCSGKVDSHGLHTERIIDHLQEVTEPGASTEKNNAVVADDKHATQNVVIKFGDAPNPLDPPKMPIITMATAPGEKSDVSTTTSAVGDNNSTVTPVNPPIVEKVPPVTGVATKETHSPTHTVELQTNGSQTLVNYYSKDLNAGVGLNGAKPTFVEIGHTSTLLNNGRDYLQNTVTGGLAFGSQFNTSRTLSITDHGPYLANQLYYDHRLGRTDGSNNTYLIASGGLSYQPESRYNVQGYGALGLKQDIGNFSLYGGAGDYSANRLSPTISPFAGASYRINKTASVNVNYDGRSWTAGVGIHF
jgi:sortase (surface protein transpeptidase)